ncbi:MAG: peptide deformylase [Clostridia bacterium]
MATRQILIDGDSLLRKSAREVTVFDSRLHQLIDDMWETMYKADGVGLAAPQVAILRRVAVVDTYEGEKIELINPVITEASGAQVGTEGCLSIPEYHCKVQRPQMVKISACDRFGKPFDFVAENFFAVACCHEIDHLDGILFKDRQYFEPNGND